MNSKSSGGIVYVLINEAMPGYVKIGKTTTSVEQRILELSRSSAVPLPFECYYAAKVADMNKVEEAFHDAFGDYRKNPRREFFTVSPERIVAVLKLLTLEEVTPDRDAGVESEGDKIALDAARKRRAAFNFKMADIPAGAELSFVRDETITCRVAPDLKHVEFQGNLMSVTGATKAVLRDNKPIQGPAYWSYEGEILSERRLRLEGAESSEDMYDAIRIVEEEPEKY